MSEPLPWLNDKKKIEEVYFELINKSNIEIFRIINLHFSASEKIYPLIEFIIERLETVTTLAFDNRIWDAEIILRSAIEALVKLIFITSAKKEEQEKRIQEFWYHLAEINSIKQSEQAKKNLEHLGHLDIHKIAYTPLLLSVEKEAELRAKWPKKERLKLEQKWSFTEILNSLSKDYHGQSFEIFTTLSQVYRMASHVAHADETGILIGRERDSREPMQKELAYFSHYLRILSDVNIFCCLVGIETMYFLGIERTFFLKNQENAHVIEELVNKYHADLFKDSIYKKYRT